MKKSMLGLVLGLLFFTGSTSWAADNCKSFKKNAMKAKKLYKMNKKKAHQLKSRVNVLKLDKKKIPKNAKLAKRVINHEIYKLSEGKRKRLAISLKYLEKHIKYTQAAKKTCSRTKATPRNRPYELQQKMGDQDMKGLQWIAAN